MPALRALGVRDSGIRAAVKRTLIVRAGRGGYALPNASPELVKAVELCAVVSHASAAALHGLCLWCPPAVLELTVPRNTQSVAEGVLIHRADLSDADRDQFRAVTSVERTLVDCGRTMGLLVHLPAAEGARGHRGDAAAGSTAWVTGADHNRKS